MRVQPALENASRDLNIYEYREIEETLPGDRERFGPAFEWQKYEHLDGEALARHAADHYYSNGEGWENDWEGDPPQFEIWKNGRCLGVFRVSMEMVPEFRPATVMYGPFRPGEEDVW